MTARRYDDDVRQFALRQNGVFLALTQDQSFAKNLRLTLLRHLQIPEDNVRILPTPEIMRRTIKLLRKMGKSIIFFIERELDGRPTTELIASLKGDYPEYPVVALTTEIGRDRLALLLEAGIGNVITKPISPETLIEKIAFTIKPRGPIGQLMDEGKAALERGDPAKALTLSRTILSDIKPGSPAALILAGDALKALGRRDEAQSAYENAASGAQMFLEPLKRLAELHNERGDPAGELEYLEKLDQLSPLNIDRKVSMGGAHLDLGHRDDAQKCFNSAVSLAGKEAAEAMGRINRSIAERCMHKAPDLSEHFLREALAARGDSLDLSDIETFNRLGLTLRKQGKWKEAVEEYRRAQSISPKDENLYYNIAMAFAEGKNFPEAELALVRAIELNPNLDGGSETVCYNIAMVFRRVSRKSQAVAFLRRALEINPDYAQAKEALTEMA